MKIRKGSLGVAIAAISFLMILALAVLAGCGSSGVLTTSHTTQYIVEADYHNARVLIYDTPFSTGQSANVVLGQANLTTANVCTPGFPAMPAPTATSMCYPTGIAQDTAGNIWVSDGAYGRVLEFQPPFSNDMPASLELGQTSLTTFADYPVTQSSLVGPSGLAFDSSGNLWVADDFNNRVLRFPSPFSNGQNANLVLGQQSFTSNTAATTASGLSGPAFLAFDKSGNLWVTDGGNDRVLEFQPPFSNDMNASMVLGQASFTASAAATTQSGLDDPLGIAFDSSGNLWIVDSHNHRVLQFEPPFSNGMNASLVLGQASFTASTPASPPTQSSFHAPAGIAFDSSGNLWVGDFFNNRTLEFTPPFSNNQNASLVLGQASFTTDGAAVTATSEFEPWGVFPAF